MKKIIGIILSLVAVNSFAGKIPEAKSLHPDLYTIQITFAWFPQPDNEAQDDKKYKHDNLGLDDKERKRVDEEYENLLEELIESDDYEELASDEREMERALLYGRVFHKALLNHIESCKEVEYKDLATIYTRSGEPFPEAYSTVKGLFDAESNTIVLSELNFEFFQGRVSSRTRFYVNEWSAVIGSSGGSNKDGYLLIKCYPPTNVSSSQKLDPTVKTSGDPVNEQGSADQH